MSDIILSMRDIHKEAQAPGTDPRQAAYSIFKIIQFMFHRVPVRLRGRYFRRLRGKMLRISPVDLGTRRLPSSAAIGQAIGITKNLLMGLDPGFVGQVIIELGKILGTA